jgi:hypothetical protein
VCCGTSETRDFRTGGLFEIKRVFDDELERIKGRISLNEPAITDYTTRRKPCSGWGNFIDRNVFMGKYLGGLLKKSR